jgi:hypothetical protein
MPPYSGKRKSASFETDANSHMGESRASRMRRILAGDPTAITPAPVDPPRPASPTWPASSPSPDSPPVPATSTLPAITTGQRFGRTVDYVPVKSANNIPLSQVAGADEDDAHAEDLVQGSQGVDESSVSSATLYGMPPHLNCLSWTIEFDPL